MKEIVYLIGIPGSGKTTFAKSLCEQDPERYIHLSSDTIRAELYGNEETQGNGELVFNILASKAANALVQSDINKDTTIIIDATNTNIRNLKKLMKSVGNYLPFEMSVITKQRAIIFAVDYDLCLERNANRSRIVPEDVMERQYQTFFENRLNNRYEQLFEGRLDYVVEKMPLSKTLNDGLKIEDIEREI